MLDCSCATSPESPSRSSSQLIQCRRQQIRPPPPRGRGVEPTDRSARWPVSCNARPVAPQLRKGDRHDEFVRAARVRGMSPWHHGHQACCAHMATRTEEGTWWRGRPRAVLGLAITRGLASCLAQRWRRSRQRCLECATSTSTQQQPASCAVKVVVTVVSTWPLLRHCLVRYGSATRRQGRAADRRRRTARPGVLVGGGVTRRPQR